MISYTGIVSSIRWRQFKSKSEEYYIPTYIYYIYIMILNVNVKRAWSQLDDILNNNFIIIKLILFNFNFFIVIIRSELYIIVSADDRNRTHTRARARMHRIITKPVWISFFFSWTPDKRYIYTIYSIQYAQKKTMTMSSSIYYIIAIQSNIIMYDDNNKVITRSITTYIYLYNEAVHI